MKVIKFLTGLLIYGLTIGVVLAALAAWWVYSEFKKPGPHQAPTMFVVERGTHANSIAWQLFDQKLVHDPYIFMIGVTVMGDHTALKAGEYQIIDGASAHDIVDTLRDGKSFQRSITIREGLTSYEIENLISAVKDLKITPLEEPIIEGSLLPETYSYSLNDTNLDVIRRMEKAMQDTIEELWPKRAENLPIKTKEEAIILASIVEKETAVSEERSRVAGVFINRLNRGIALQTDPTVIYALTKGRPKNDGKGPLGRRLLRKDLTFESPYNTYKYSGLPPGPIANPGRASIEAVLNPEEHDFIYFVADGTGGHAFAKTLAGHNANVAKWRKIRKQKP